MAKIVPVNESQWIKYLSTLKPATQKKYENAVRDFKVYRGINNY